MATTPSSGRSFRTSCTPLATTFRASMSRPELVSSRIATSGSRIAIWRISLRFFSPPEKPSLRYRSRNDGSISSRSIHSMIDSRNSRTERSMPLRPERAWRKKLSTDTPAIVCGYWKARNMPALPRTSVGQSVMSSPRKTSRPCVTSYSGLASRVDASVDFPDPFGPMRACTSPAPTVRSTPFRIDGTSLLVPATRTCRSSIWNRGAGGATGTSLENARPHSHYRRRGNSAKVGGSGLVGRLLGLLRGFVGAFLELLLRLPETASELRQLGPAEQQQDHSKDEKQFEGADVRHIDFPFARGVHRAYGTGTLRGSSPERTWGRWRRNGRHVKASPSSCSSDSRRTDCDHHHGRAGLGGRGDVAAEVRPAGEAPDVAVVWRLRAWHRHRQVRQHLRDRPQAEPL